MTKKYTIYDGDTNTIIFETDDIVELNYYKDYNLEYSNLLYVHHDEDMVILYCENYVIYMKL